MPPKNTTHVPAFADDLILYEIATKAFTSPNGPESGTFASTKEKLPYLEELGITGIWLSGHQHCDDRHFYNIWTEYACIRPDRLDPSLGTEAEFKALVDEAHRRNMRVFLDVITHGVMSDSPLIEAHPHWFSGGSWGMTDFDWFGNHQDLDDWWVDTWTRYCVEFGIDGFRLDVAHYRKDLWAKIRANAKAAGREILIMGEHGPATDGVVDMIQTVDRISSNDGINHRHLLLWDAAGYCQDRANRRFLHYIAAVQYDDNTVQTSGPMPDGFLEHAFGLEKAAPDASLRLVRGENFLRQGDGYAEQMGSVRLENADIYKKAVRVLLLCPGEPAFDSEHPDVYTEFSQTGGTIAVSFPLYQQQGTLLSSQLSSHDGGWEGFPLDENPYGGQGSRHRMGYVMLLAPAVPIFMAGEEFDAGYRPLPRHSPFLFGGENLGQGRWLYASWLDWTQTAAPRHAAMLADTKAMIALRKRFSHLIRPGRMEAPVAAVPVACTAETPLPKPYAYLGEGEALFVAGNPGEKTSLRFYGENLLQDGNYTAQTLFGPAETRRGRLADVLEKPFFVEKDKTAGGGLLVVWFKRENQF